MALVDIFPGVSDKAIYIHNGVNMAQFAAVENPGRNSAGRRYILCIASLRPEKGIDVLIRAAKPLLETDESMRLLLAGDGPLREEMETLADSLGIRDEVQFLGTKSRSEVVRLLHECDVLVVPSRAESFGLVVIEALACKKPVVAAAVGGIPEIVEHERRAFLSNRITRKL
jgi:glycosyltransferase involved in cell wall biosynthesis